MLKSNGSTTAMNFVAVLVLVSLPTISASASSSSTPPPYQKLHRCDPLHHFKFYDEGYDIRNKHYWASVAFTGVHGYAVAGAWVACGLGFGLLLISKNATCSRVSELGFPGSCTSFAKDTCAALQTFLVNPQNSSLNSLLPCSSNESSTVPGCLPESYYSIAYAYIRSIQDLIGAYPDLDGLIHCNFVKNKLSDAELRHCNPFKSSTKRLWISMLCLSTAMAALVLLWIAKACRDSGRSSLLCSIAPNQTQL